jgi:hypothetical protein
VAKGDGVVLPPSRRAPSVLRAAASPGTSWAAITRHGIVSPRATRRAAGRLNEPEVSAFVIARPLCGIR